MASLLERLRKSMVHAPAGALSADTQRRLWAHACAAKDNASRQRLIGRSDAPADLVEQYRQVRSPATLRAAYLLRADVTREELDEALAGESRVAVLNAIVSSEHATGEAYEAVARRAHPLLARRIVESPNAPPSAVLMSLSVLSPITHKLPRSAVAALYSLADRDGIEPAAVVEALMLPDRVVDGARPAFASTWTAARIASRCAELPAPEVQERFAAAITAELRASKHIYSHELSTVMAAVTGGKLLDPEHVASVRAALEECGPLDRQKAAYERWCNALWAMVPSAARTDHIPDAELSTAVVELVERFAAASATPGKEGLAALKAEAAALLRDPRLTDDAFCALAAGVDEPMHRKALTQRALTPVVVAHALGRFDVYSALPFSVDVFDDDGWSQVLREMYQQSGSRGVRAPLLLDPALRLARLGVLGAGVIGAVRVSSLSLADWNPSLSAVLASLAEEHVMAAAAAWAEQTGRDPEVFLSVFDGIAEPDSELTLRDALEAAALVLEQGT